MGRVDFNHILWHFDRRKIELLVQVVIMNVKMSKRSINKFLIYICKHIYLTVNYKPFTSSPSCFSYNFSSHSCV